MPPRSPSDESRAQSRRRARVAAVLGVSAGCLMVWGSLVALNQWILGFDAWPENDAPRAQRLVVPDAPRPQTTAGTSAVAAVPLAGRLGLFTGGTPAVLPSGERVALTVIGRRRTAAQTTPARTGSPGGVVAPGNGGAVAGGSADPDGDGISTALEIRRGTNPASADTDNDGAPDGWEVKHGLNPRDFRDGGDDADGDGVKNVTEFRLGDDPNRPSSRDGVPDGSRDTNGDGVTDAISVEQGTDPSAPPVVEEPAPIEEPAPTPTEASPRRRPIPLRRRRSPRRRSSPRRSPSPTRRSRPSRSPTRPPTRPPRPWTAPAACRPRTSRRSTPTTRSTDPAAPPADAAPPAA